MVEDEEPADFLAGRDGLPLYFIEEKLPLVDDYRFLSICLVLKSDCLSL